MQQQLYMISDQPSTVCTVSRCHQEMNLLLLLLLLPGLSSSQLLTCQRGEDHVSLRCVCQSENNDTAVSVQISSLLESQPDEAVKQGIEILNCSNLQLNLSAFPSQLSFRQIEKLVLNIENLTHNETLKETPSGQDDKLFLHLSIGLGALSGVLLILLVVLSLFFLSRRTKRNDEPHNKQVSRAESWRYESNIYIKPPVNKPQVVQTQSHNQNPFSSLRYKPAEALSSSPLMRKKPTMPLIRGADIVRTTLPVTPDVSKRENLRRDRNDTYHGHVREHSDTDYALSPSSESETDEEVKKDDIGYESSTLPFQ